jgi:hypothetical protein
MPKVESLSIYQEFLIHSIGMHLIQRRLISKKEKKIPRRFMANGKDVRIHYLKHPSSL